MGRKIILTLCVVLLTHNGLRAQWFGTINNLAGNWKTFVNNRGLLFNQGNSSGGHWHNTEFIFGAGIWIGGKVKVSNGKIPVTATTFDPNTGASQFIPGSYSPDSPLVDTMTTQYLPKLSSIIPANTWPLRQRNSYPWFNYYDDSVGNSNGAPYYMGDENIFTVYKNSDPRYWVGFNHNTDIMPLFEIRTNIAYWASGIGADVVIVKNQLIYHSNVPLYDPVVALCVDPDVTPLDLEVANIFQGFDQDSLHGCYFYDKSYDTSGAPGPIGAIYLLEGLKKMDGNNANLTTIRRWTFGEDITSPAKRYWFMTDGSKDTSKSPYNYLDIRGLLASASDKPLLQGDTLNFTYALYAYYPKTISPEVDLAPFIETGKKITGLFQTGKISEIGLHTSQQINVTLFPNPTTDKVIIQSSKKELWSIEIYDVLGAKVISYLPGTMVESATLSTTTLPVGLYTVVINHNQTMKLIKQ